jgi:hypothetical protein
MQRDTRLLLFDISAFYVFGIAFLVFNYQLDRQHIFFFVMLFWTKMTTVFVAIGLIYWLYCILAGLCNLPVRTPIRRLRYMYLGAGALLLVLQIMRWPPPYLE